MPIPEVGSFDELNARLARETAAEERTHRARQTDTVGERFATERPLLAPLPARPFLACTRHPVRASSQALVAFDGSRYSVPVRHAGAALWLRAYATTVEIWTATTIVARHPRATAKGDAHDRLLALPARPRPQARRLRQRDPGPPGGLPARARGAARSPRGGPPERSPPGPPRVPRGLCPERRRRAGPLASGLRDRPRPGEVSAAGVRAAIDGTMATPVTRLRLPARLADVAVPAGDVDQYSRLLRSRS